jgi:predicted lipid-binding transport protein (Tim44 family)
MNLYDVLALGLFAAVAAALWRAFRAGEGQGGKIAADQPLSPDVIKVMKRKTIPCEEAPKDEADDGVAERAERLSRIDRSFEPQAFMERAKDMFSAILKAFEGGDKKALKEMVSPAVFKAFARDMDDLASNGRRIETEIVRFKRIFIKGIEIGRKSASVIVEFQTEQTALVKDADGNILEGDDNQIELVSDVWKFSKEPGRRRAGWILEATMTEKDKQE